MFRLFRFYGVEGGEIPKPGVVEVFRDVSLDGLVLDPDLLRLDAVLAKPLG
jgi:hypothetical protein